jgi:transposase
MAEWGPAGRVRLTPEIRRRIVALKKQGLTNTDISERLQCGYTTICKVMREKHHG